MLNAHLMGFFTLSKYVHNEKFENNYYTFIYAQCNYFSGILDGVDGRCKLLPAGRGFLSVQK